MIDAALERRMGFALFAGDLYDGAQRDWYSGQFLKAQLSRLTREGIEIVAIRGNHDAENAHEATMPLPGMLGSAAPETKLLQRYPVAVHGQSFATKAVTANIVQHYPVRVPDRFNIGLLHTACGQVGHDNYAPCNIEDLKMHGYNYWALGHVHARQVLSQDPWIVFSGVLQGRHINEEGEKGATFVTVQDGQVQSAELRSFDVLRWLRMKVDVGGVTSETEGLERVRIALSGAALASEGRMLAVQISLTGESSMHAELARAPGRILALARGTAQEVASADDLWIEDVKIDTAPPELARWREQPGVVGALTQALDRPVPIEAELAEFVQDQLRRTGDTLDAGHPARALADGVVPKALLAQARAFVIAELMK